MTTNDFRRLALALGDAVEGAHMNHPDFRIGGRIFATIKPDGVSGMVRLSSDDQRRLVSERPESFEPEAGAWGRQGCTRVSLQSLDEDTLGEALTLAWQFARESARRRKPVRASASRKGLSNARKARVRKRR
jgi:hypothetical protein